MSLPTDLRNAVERMLELAQAQEDLLRQQTDNLLAHRPVNPDKVKHLLDVALDIILFGKGIDEFNRLLASLRTLDPIAADDYQKYYEEITAPDTFEPD